MQFHQMAKTIAEAKVGNVIQVRCAGGRRTTYRVRKVNGKRARELWLDGRRGAQRVLVDGGDAIWMREASARADSTHRRVMEVRSLSATGANATTLPQPAPPVSEELCQVTGSAISRLLDDPDRVALATTPLGILSSLSAAGRALVRIDGVLGHMSRSGEMSVLWVDELLDEILLLKLIQVRTAQTIAPEM